MSNNEKVAPVETVAEAKVAPNGGEFSINLKIGPRPSLTVTHGKSDEVFMESGEEN